MVCEMDDTFCVMEAELGNESDVVATRPERLREVGKSLKLGHMQTYFFILFYTRQRAYVLCNEPGLAMDIRGGALGYGRDHQSGSARQG